MEEIKQLAPGFAQTLVNTLLVRGNCHITWVTSSRPESKFVLRILPPALRYLEALALKLALREVAIGEAAGEKDVSSRQRGKP
jgi:hypothetical protein